MIRIRYADLPEGLHAQAEVRGRRTVIFLRPGLTTAQRRESLRRVRHSARMGYGPRLSATGVAVAIAVDRSLTTLRNLGAAVRWHPVASVLLLAALGGLAVSYAMLVADSIRIVPEPTFQVAAPPPAVHPLAGPILPGPQRSRTSGPTPVPGGPVPGGPGDPGALPSPAGPPSPQASDPGPQPSPTSPSPSPSGPSPSPSPVVPSPSPSPSPTRLCLHIGPLGLCL